MMSIYITAAYIRLSREDGDRSESDSIGNQRDFLREYIQRHPELILKDYYVDDGYSGTNFERPGFRRMMEAVEKGEVDCILVKDLSRFGRDYIETGRYLERYFPEKGIRFIAAADQIDSLERAYNLFLPLKNILNEQYARDISEKVHVTMRNKQKLGQFIGAFAAYGYRKDPKDRNHLIRDAPAAGIVQRIFREYAQGHAIREIAEGLNRDQIPSPIAYKRLNGERYQNRRTASEGKEWTYSGVCRILHSELYTGAVVQGRREQYMHRKPRNRRKEEWIVVKGMHEPLIERELWENVQSMLRNKRQKIKD
ncbi:MAG: recombinase family protein [Clostridiales bacterium]|nr:recombinase family protein [Clostridiales bacterium]